MRARQSSLLALIEAPAIEITVTKVLVVDDFVPWHRLVQWMLEGKKDLDIVAVAVDGLEAVQKAEQLQPDLILLDVGLPTLNGFEASRQIQKLCPNSKILFVSNETSAEVVEEALHLGAQGYLLKPNAASELLHAVEAILRGEQFVSSRLRSDVITRSGIAPGSDKTQKSGEVKTSRVMEWDISGQKAVYTCTLCAWELVVEVGTCPEPFRLFEQHVCESYVLRSRVHEVASYRDDSLFIDGFTRFIETALNKGNPAIAIVTEAHQRSIRKQLQIRNVAAGMQERLYASFDVNEALSMFMVDDWPDATRLIEWVGDVIMRAARAATGQSARVAICGECAPILWAQGKSDAAIQLERLWDTIAESHDVDILCGYSFASLRRSENSHIFERIRAMHSAAYSD